MTNEPRSAVTMEAIIANQILLIQIKKVQFEKTIPGSRPECYNYISI